MEGFCLVCFLFLFLLCPSLIFASDDRLTPGMSISGDKKLISAGGTFVLGFFSPGSSTYHYLGIWYNKIEPLTVVWVANREVPLKKNSPGTFMLSSDSNLVIFDGRKNVIWFSNLSVVVTRNSSFVIITDSGNLILRDVEGTALWESFHYPTDTILPGMTFGLNLKNGHNDRLISWNKPDDPAPGVFSFAIDPRGPLQMLIWQSSRLYSRWNGQKGNISYRENGHNYITDIKFNITDEGHYVKFTVSDKLIVRFVLGREGKIKFITWKKDIKEWEVSWLFPVSECDRYGQCGPSGLCNNSNPSSMCGCMEGFKPFSQKGWSNLDHSAGCVRKEKICENGDGFSKVEKVKLPDYSILLFGNFSDEECKHECLRNCSCTAYVYDNGGSGFTSSCLNWDGKLVDVSTDNTEERDIYIRLARAELVGTGMFRKTSHTFTIVAATVAVGVLLVGAACCVLWRRIGEFG